MRMQETGVRFALPALGPRLAVVAIIVGSLLVSAPHALANAYPNEPAPVSPPICTDGGAPATVSIDAGTVTNTTTLDLSADGGTGIGDSSGGNDNTATTGDGGKDHKGNGKHDNGKNKKNDRRDDEPETAAAGNGGVSNASANGGAISTGNVNSGGNVGNAIGVGDTWGSGYDPCGNAIPAVRIVGGTVTNQTLISVSADGGTAIADASGGDNNVASTGGRAGNGGSITSSAGNGGVSTASANGGAISLGDINSGGNAGNAIAVGGTVAGPVPVCCASPPINSCRSTRLRARPRHPPRFRTIHRAKSSSYRAPAKGWRSPEGSGPGSLAGPGGRHGELDGETPHGMTPEPYPQRASPRDPTPRGG